MQFDKWEGAEIGFRSLKMVKEWASRTEQMRKGVLVLNAVVKFFPN